VDEVMGVPIRFVLIAVSNAAFVDGADVGILL
jgi:hypothetical protein